MDPVVISPPSDLSDPSALSAFAADINTALVDLSRRIAEVRGEDNTKPQVFGDINFNNHRLMGVRHSAHGSDACPRDEIIEGGGLPDASGRNMFKRQIVAQGGVRVPPSRSDSDAVPRSEIKKLAKSFATLAITDLTDVTAKTGTGTVVVMQGSPVITTPTIADFTNATHDHQNAAGGGQLDHGAALTGLTDDDHTIYALLTGRSGGQTLIGGTGSGDDLTLTSTSHATKGSILFGSSAYDEANDRLGIADSTPSYELDVAGDGRFTGSLALADATPLSHRILGITETFADDTNPGGAGKNLINLDFTASPTGATGGAASHRALYAQIDSGAATALTNGQSLVGLGFLAQHNQAVNATGMFGMVGQAFVGPLFGTGGSATATDAFGANVQVLVTSGASTPISDMAAGGRFVCTHKSTGTVDTLVGGSFEPQVTGAGTVTTLHGASIDLATVNTAGSTLTNAAGVRVDGWLSNPTYTNPPAQVLLEANSETSAIGVRQQGGSNENRFASYTTFGEDAAPLAPVDARQVSASGAAAALRCEQADVSEEFLRFIGSAAAATLTQSIVAEADVTTATRAGFLKVWVQDDGNQITDQAYFIPIFTLA